MRSVASPLSRPVWAPLLAALAAAAVIAWTGHGTGDPAEMGTLLAAARSALVAGPHLPAKLDPGLAAEAQAGEQVRVVVRSTPGARAQVEAAVAGLGGTVEVGSGDWLQAVVPPAALEDLVRLPSVVRIDRPLPMLPAGPVSEGFRTMALEPAPPFPGAGAGVKIGIIDSFGDYQRLVGSELPPPERLVYRSFTPNPGQSRHDTAVAEVVYDAAPGATLYLAEATTIPEVAAAVDWLLQQGVQVINMSMNAPFAPPSDGNGLDALTVEKAARQGAVWVNAGGNFANKHWLGDWRDANGNGLQDFAPGSDVNRMLVPAGRPVGFMVVLRWNDPWGGSCNDYDLTVSWNDPTYGPQAVSATATQDCSSGAQPLEVATGNAVSADGTLAVAISRRGNAQPRRLELFVWGGTLENSVPTYSVAPPADSANALAAGAVASWDASFLQPYSGRGPAWTGAVKPDFVAPDVVSTATFGPMGFAGTSAAAPHLAAVVALVKQAYPSWGPAQVRAYLRERALDLGTPGADNDYGYGLVYMGGGLPFGLPQPPAGPAIHPLDDARAWITWGAPAEATTYRICRSPSPTFDAGVACTDRSADGYSFAVVDVPSGDLETHYYRLQACNPFGCSAPVPAGGIVRRQWPDATGWDFYATVSTYAGYTIVKARNLRATGSADLELYQGLQGFPGALLRHTCAGLAPAAQCEAVWPGGGFVSVAQALGPWRVGAGLLPP
ncbi:Subtilisin BL [bacterium HR24]|nr:Subtilisin BL [bacterium HR24]